MHHNMGAFSSVLLFLLVRVCTVLSGTSHMQLHTFEADGPFDVLVLYFGVADDLPDGKVARKTLTHMCDAPQALRKTWQNWQLILHISR